MGNDPVNLVDPTGLDDEPPNCPQGTVPMRDAEGKWQCVGVGNNPVDVPIPRDDDISELLPRQIITHLLFIRVEPFRNPTIPPIELDPEPELEPEAEPEDVPVPGDREQAVRDCILRAGREYLDEQFKMGVLAYGAWTGMGLLTASLVLTRGQAAGFMEFYHLSEGRSRIAAAYAPFALALGYSARKHLANYKKYKEAVKACHRT